MKKFVLLTNACLAAAFLVSCNDSATPSAGEKNDSLQSYAQKHTAGYATVKLTTDLSQLTEKEKQMIPLLIEAAKIMDTLYWDQS